MELPPLGPEMNHTMNLKDSNVLVKTRPSKCKQKFLNQLCTKLRQEEASGRVHKSSDTCACAMFIIPQINKPNQARFLDDLLARNSNIIMEPPNISDQSSIINSIVRYPSESKIDVSNGYYNSRIHPTHEKHTAFVTSYATYRTRVMQQGECNTTATIHKIMNNLFKDELGIFIYVHIDDIFICSETCKAHLAHARIVR